MPQITLNKKQIDQFSAFLRKHDVKKWFLAKDDGAYIGATGGSEEEGTFENILFYFKGMDPKKDGEDTVWENAHQAFGGDDFGEHFDAEVVHNMADDALTTKMVVNVGAKSISVKSWAKTLPAGPVIDSPKPPKKSAAPKKPTAPKKKGVGSFAVACIEAGMSNEEVLKSVMLEFPEAKTSSNCINWYRNKVRKAL